MRIVAVTLFDLLKRKGIRIIRSLTKPLSNLVLKHLRQPRFTYSTCGLFTKNKEKIQKFNETGDSRYIYQNELSKSCFQHDMAYRDFKDLPRRIASDKVLRDKAFNVVKTPKYNGYQRGLASVVNRFFDKKSLDDDVKIKLCQINS